MSCCPVATSHRRAVKSVPSAAWPFLNRPPLPERARLPSGENATLQTTASWPLNLRISLETGGDAASADCNSSLESALAEALRSPARDRGCRVSWHHAWYSGVPCHLS